MSQKLHNFPKTTLLDNKMSSTARYGLVGVGVLLVIAIIVSIVFSRNIVINTIKSTTTVVETISCSHQR